MSRPESRRDFPGGLDAAEFWSVERTDSEIVAQLDILIRARNRLRHARETLSVAGKDTGNSRESLRKAKHVAPHADLVNRLSDDSLDSLYREAMLRQGRTLPKRTSISISDARAAARVLLSHFDATELLDAITQELGYVGNAGTTNDRSS